MVSCLLRKDLKFFAYEIAFHLFYCLSVTALKTFLTMVFVFFLDKDTANVPSKQKSLLPKFPRDLLFSLQSTT